MNKIKIMIVDDHPVIRNLVSEWLKNAGYDTVSAIDGSDCINKLTNDIELILLDIMMPGLTPEKIIDQVTKQNPNTRIIYLSAVDTFNPTPEQKIKGWIPVIKYPIVGYLLKPVNETTLLSKIKEVLRKKATIYGINKEVDVIKY